MGRVPPDARALHTPWIVAKVLLLISAGLRLPRPPGAKLRKAPPGVNCEDAMSPGLRPAAAAIAAMLALVGSWEAPCRAAERLEADTITCPVPKVDAKEEGA